MKAPRSPITSFRECFCRQGQTFVLLMTFLLNTLGPLPAQAQEFVLPKPGVMVHLSPAFNPPVLKGIKVHLDNPFRFDFILDKGDAVIASEAKQSQEQLKTEATKLIKYFLASLTIPEKDLWVNLSPYEKDRIVPESFGQTEMGRDLLAQDYMLKQITASLIYPEDEIGKKFWKRVYEEAQKKYGTTQVPVNTFNKVWIVPEKAVVYENAKAGTAYVVESKLKVMLEQDYLALEKNTAAVISAQVGIQDKNDINVIGSQIVREIVIPELTKEVNEGKNFAQLRQVYQSLILATWYKKKIKDSILSQVYADKNKVAGVNIDDPQEKEKIYQQYLQAFKKGVYNYIKEEMDPIVQEVTPRKYFSGGLQLLLPGFVEGGMTHSKGDFGVTNNERDIVPPASDNQVVVEAGFKQLEFDFAMSTNDASVLNHSREIFDRYFQTFRKKVRAMPKLDYFNTIYNPTRRDVFALLVVAQNRHDEIGSILFKFLSWNPKLKDDIEYSVETLLADSVGRQSLDDSSLKETAIRYSRLSDSAINELKSRAANYVISRNDESRQRNLWEENPFTALRDIVRQSEDKQTKKQAFRVLRELAGQEGYEAVQMILYISRSGGALENADLDTVEFLTNLAQEKRFYYAEDCLVALKDLYKASLEVIKDLNKDAKSAADYREVIVTYYVIMAIMDMGQNGGEIFHPLLGKSIKISPQTVSLMHSLDEKAAGINNHSWDGENKNQFYIVVKHNRNPYRLNAAQYIYRLAMASQNGEDLLENTMRTFQDLRIARPLAWIQKVIVENRESIVNEELISNRLNRNNFTTDKRPVAVFISSISDWNTAMFNLENKIKESMEHGYRVMYYEVSSFEEALSALDDATSWEDKSGKKTKPATMVWFNVHGSPDTMHFNQPLGIESLTEDKITELSQRINGAVDKDTLIVSESCSSGGCNEITEKAGGNIAQKVFQVFKLASATDESPTMKAPTLVLNSTKLVTKEVEGRKRIVDVEFSRKNTPVPTMTIDDKAMINSLTKKGGIDLTPANMNLQTQDNSDEIKFNVDPAMLEQFKNALGFTPVIINILPMNNLREFLGVAP